MASKSEALKSLTIEELQQELARRENEAADKIRAEIAEAKKRVTELEAKLAQLLGRQKKGPRKKVENSKERVFDALKSIGGPASRDDIATKAGLEPGLTSAKLQTLKKEKRVTKEGTTRDTTWQIAN